MRFTRRYTQPEGEPFGVKFSERVSVIRNEDGTSASQEYRVLAPESWSQTAVDILVQKYFRKAGVPDRTHAVEDPGVPLELSRRWPDPTAAFGGETDARQVFRRLAGAWAYWGWKGGYFDALDDALAFRDDLLFMLANQIFAPASPQWFGTGLHWAYGITGPDQGLWAITDDETCTVDPCPEAYPRPLVHACFIQSVEDHLVGPYGITDAVVREARIFKFGGGSGSNFSRLRGKGELLSGGGRSSGTPSWLKILDSNAGAIKSGGTTRRAAKMVVLDADHPDIEEFVTWKVREEDKVAMLVAGSRCLRRHAAAFNLLAAEGDPGKKAAGLKVRAAKARRDGVPAQLVAKLLGMAERGETDVGFAEMTTQFEGEAFCTVTAQNANNSVRVPNRFMRAVEEDSRWDLLWRTDTSRPAKTVQARVLWDSVVKSAWLCADPGLVFGDNVNAWNGCIGDEEIVACNPCAEYNWFDDTACNLASLNLVKFWTGSVVNTHDHGRNFDLGSYQHAASLATVVLDITIGMAGYPSERIAKRSAGYRTLGLGYANLGALLMRMGVPYDSDQGRAVAACLTAIMHARSATVSAAMANALGQFPAYERNREGMLRVVYNHTAACLRDLPDSGYAFRDLEVEPPAAKMPYAGHAFFYAAKYECLAMWDAARRYGLRNAQLTLLAPTGTIGLLMDCDTTGVEPDFALVKHKKLAGGGYMKIANQSVGPALTRLGYDRNHVNMIVRYVEGAGPAGIEDAPYSLWGRLRDAGIDPDGWGRGLSGTDIRLNLEQDAAEKYLGMTPDQVRDVNDHLFGRMTVEGAPGFREEHLAVFDCANRCGRDGTRFLPYRAHLRMMAAVQPFLSGGISKTVNLPAGSTREQVAACYREAWELALKQVALYVDGSKLSQPLTTAGQDDDAGLLDVVAEANTPNGRVVVRYLAKRRKLPDRRAGVTQKFRVGGHKFYIRTGEYPDGTLGEIFVDAHPMDGEFMRASLSAISIAISLALQYGVPLAEFVEAFQFSKFEPSGPVQGHPRIKNATSVMDAIVRHLAIDYLGRDDLAHVPDSPRQPDPDPEYTEEVVLGAADPVSSVRAWPDGSAPALEAKTLGYDGTPCGACREYKMVRRGKCLACAACGATTGCS